MAVYITGDMHGSAYRLNPGTIRFFLRDSRKELSEEDIVIVCGDFGMPWGNGSGCVNNLRDLDGLAEQPFTILFIDGNHENFDLLEKLPVEEKFGGMVHRVRDNIFHLLRGEIYSISGRTFFAFGGAASVDRGYRVAHESWWPQEVCTEDEKFRALANLEKCGYKVDYVLTHAAPERFILKKFSKKIISPCPTSRFLSELEPKLKYRKWYFGHYHIDNQSKRRREQWMYESIIKIID